MSESAMFAGWPCRRSRAIARFGEDCSSLPGAARNLCSEIRLVTMRRPHGDSRVRGAGRTYEAMARWMSGVLCGRVPPHADAESAGGQPGAAVQANAHDRRRRARRLADPWRRGLDAEG